MMKKKKFGKISYLNVNFYYFYYFMIFITYSDYNYIDK